MEMIAIETPLAAWNMLPADMAEASLLSCCGSHRWASTLVAQRPFVDSAQLMHAACNLWFLLDEKDWLEAFACHPRIGDRRASEAASAQSASWSEGEQAAAQESLDGLAETLAKENEAYERRYGFTYIVCASGRTAPELLEVLRDRMLNSRGSELHEAARQQHQITTLRMNRWLEL